MIGTETIYRWVDDLPLTGYWVTTEAEANERGWYRVDDSAPRPSDDEVNHYVSRYVFANNVFTRVWDAVPWSEDELAQRAAEAAEQDAQDAAAAVVDAERDQARSAITALSDFIDLGSPSAADVVAQVKLQARILRRLIKDQYGE